jgi:hypothetical protein
LFVFVSRQIVGLFKTIYVIRGLCLLFSTIIDVVGLSLLGVCDDVVSFIVTGPFKVLNPHVPLRKTIKTPDR